MKNNFLKYLFLVLIFFINIPSISDEVIFETEEINITRRRTNYKSKMVK